eukprot:6565476-Pyramimonas_sp.AAC.1
MEVSISWRAVGTPKSEIDVGPMSVDSISARCQSPAPPGRLPQTPGAQRAGRRQRSIVSASAAWLLDCESAQAGAGIDLGRACDHVDHAIGAMDCL